MTKDLEGGAESVARAAPGRPPAASGSARPEVRPLDLVDRGGLLAAIAGAADELAPPPSPLRLEQ